MFWAMKLLEQKTSLLGYWKDPESQGNTNCGHMSNVWVTPNHMQGNINYNEISTDKVQNDK